MIPTSEQQIIQEAIRKASLLSQAEAAYRVGFSEGVVEINGQLYTCVWCAVLSSSNDVGLSGGLHIRLTNKLERQFKSGKLTSERIEAFILSIDEQPYEILVKGAIKMLTQR